MNKPRVLLADDHRLVLEGFRKLLEDQCDLVGMVEDGRALLEAATRLRPDIVILDISMPLLNGIDAARQVKKRLPNVKVIFITMHADPAYVTAAFKAGGSGYLLKRSASDELEAAIQSVLNGHYYLTPLITKDVIERFLEAPPEETYASNDLTSRQREVLQLLAEGRSVKEIARILDISPRTVEFHKSQLMEQLSLHSTADLIKYAIAHGLTTTS